MNDWEIRQEEKKERYLDLAERADREAQAQRRRSDQIADMIPMGQPILVGHHSEKRHRRDLDRIHSGMRKSIEATEKAEHYRAKVDNIENPRAISSDDPDAIAKLREKLAGMEKQREAYKEKNKQLRREKKDTIPAYVFSNLGGNIRRVRERIKHLEAQKTVNYPTVEREGIEVEHNKDINRIQVRFPAIPAPEVRQRLKSNGFRWSPREGAWQRHTSRWAYNLGLSFLPEVTE